MTQQNNAIDVYLAPRAIVRVDANAVLPDTLIANVMCFVRESELAAFFSDKQPFAFRPLAAGDKDKAQQEFNDLVPVCLPGRFDFELKLISMNPVDSLVVDLERSRMSAPHRFVEKLIKLNSPIVPEQGSKAGLVNLPQTMFDSLAQAIPAAFAANAVEQTHIVEALRLAFLTGKKILLPIKRLGDIPGMLGELARRDRWIIREDETFSGHSWTTSLHFATGNSAVVDIVAQTIDKIRLTVKEAGAEPVIVVSDLNGNHVVDFQMDDIRKELSLVIAKGSTPEDGPVLNFDPGLSTFPPGHGGDVALVERCRNPSCSGVRFLPQAMDCVPTTFRFPIATRRSSCRPNRARSRSIPL